MCLSLIVKLFRRRLLHLHLSVLFNNLTCITGSVIVTCRAMRFLSPNSPNRVANTCTIRSGSGPISPGPQALCIKFESPISGNLVKPGRSRNFLLKTYTQFHVVYRGSECRAFAPRKFAPYLKVALADISPFLCLSVGHLPLVAMTFTPASILHNFIFLFVKKG